MAGIIPSGVSPLEIVQAILPAIGSLWSYYSNQSAAQRANQGTSDIVNNIVGNYGDWSRQVANMSAGVTGAAMATQDAERNRTRQQNMNNLNSILYGAPITQAGGGADVGSLAALLNSYLSTPTTQATNAQMNAAIAARPEFDLNWLTPDQRRQVDFERATQGGVSKYGSPVAYNDYLYQTYRDQVPQDVQDQFGMVIPGHPNYGMSAPAATDTSLSKALARGQVKNPTPGSTDAAQSALPSNLPEALQGYAGRYTSTMGLLDTMGNAAKTELNRNYAGLGSNIQQNLVSSGLSNSAALPGALSGVERQRTTNLSALNEQISTQKAGFSSALAGDYLTNLTSALNNATQMDAQYGQNVVNQFTQGAQFAIPTLTDLLNSQSQYKTLALPQGPPPMNPGDLFTSLSSVLTANRGAGRAEEWLRNAQASAQSNAFWNFLGMGTGPAGAVGGAAAGAGIFG